MNPNDRKQRRRALTRCFFFHNRTAAFLAMSAVILNIPLNLAVAWQMQQLIDIAAGSPSAFTLPQISAALALSFAVMAAIMALGKMCIRDSHIPYQPSGISRSSLHSGRRLRKRVR